MRKSAAPAELQRWSEEVARDAGAPSFVPLADAYRRQGNREAAIRVCMRGLERNPSNVEAHLLLARIYLETGDRERAHDEWGFALHLDAENFEAHRGVGFVHLERGDFGTARRHLDRAAAARPDDPAVQEALTVLTERLRGGAAQGHGEGQGHTQGQRQPAAGPVDPVKLFDTLRRETPFLGAVILDAQGLVLAGALSQDAAGTDAEALGAILSGAIEEAARTADLLELGAWRGIMLETEQAQLHITVLPDQFMVLLAADPDAPAGWVVRAAQRATELSKSFLQGAA